MGALLILATAAGGYLLYRVMAAGIQRVQEQELQNEAQLRDKQYDRIVNCPTCEGSGECWMDWRVTGDGHVLAPTPQRRADIERMMDDNFNYIRPESYFHVDSFDTSYSYKRAACPHCEETGTAYGWFETVPEAEARCQSCSGAGVVLQTVKAEIGVHRMQVRCAGCAGIGRTIVPLTRKVHVKWNGHGASQSFDLALFEPSRFFDASKPRFGRDAE
jgi:hypothetical protein